jgi:hypothetical protein
MNAARANITMSSEESEERFRQIFSTHLVSEGFTTSDAYRLILKTPARFHHAPPTDDLSLLDSLRHAYRPQLPCSWFFEGVNQGLQQDARWLEAPARPVTFVVIPGIFGEFIEQLPFQPIVDHQSSHFASRWRTALQQANDSVYSSTALHEVPARLGDLVGIGSLDQGERSFANVLILKARGGSLETLGSLASNAQVYTRRLNSVFGIIDDDTDIYLVGYSRGLAVALEMVSTLHDAAKKGDFDSSAQRWFGRIRGVVGLGGVYYGAKFASDVLNGKSGATSTLLKLLRQTSDKLVTVPTGARLPEKNKVVLANAGVWAGMVKGVSEARSKIAAGKHFLGMDLGDAFEREGKARIRGREVPLPNPFGIFALVNGFLLRTFELKRFVTRYNDNVTAFKRLVDAVVTGVETLTPESRDEWWKTHDLPKDLRLFSITGSMPEAFLDGFESPLWKCPGFGATTSDFNISLRASYYDTLSAEDTLMNDSQVSHFGSRYWAEMYPAQRYTHYYLGVLGTHHWGMALPFTIRDKSSVGGNPFPRETMLKSVAAFISSLPAAEG